MNNSVRRKRMTCRVLGLFLAAVFMLSCVMGRGVLAAQTDETTAGTQETQIPQTTEAAQTEKKNKPYTKAAPFMPVAASTAVMTLDLADEPSPNAAENGLILSKSATYDESTDSALIRLEAYVTGTVTTETVEKEIPCDIVLVLDFSNSMTGNFTNENQTRGEALQTAVNNFIDSVSEKYTAGETNHRITLIYYNGEGASAGKSAKVGNDWTDVTADNVPELKITDTERVNWIVSGTNTDQGMSKALEQLNKLGEEEEVRSKVVILFTDGELSDYKADDAINTSKRIKDLGCTVYTVATHASASATSDPELTEGVTIAQEDSSGEVSARYINAVMHAISSNYPSIKAAADDVAPKQITFSNVRINPMADKNGSGAIDNGEPSYYLVATSTSSLNTIFQSIASNIQSGTASMQLGSSTVVKDIVSDYFDLPEDASAVTVKTYECLSYEEETDTAVWSDTGTILSDAVTLDAAGKAVNVTGFDFSKNFVSENGRDEADADQAGDFHGRKLVITFAVPVRAGFLGGNQVPTNGSATGIYSGGTLIEAFEQPMVDVPVKTPVVSVPDYHIYLLGGKTEEQLKAGTMVTAAGQTIDLQSGADNYGLQAWQNAYVTISADPLTGFESLTGDAAYTARVVFTPKNTGTYQATSGTDTGSIYVYKPVITYKDSTIILGDTADYESQNSVSEVWMHGETAASSGMGAAPALSYSYAPAEAPFQVDTPVKVSMKIGTTDITAYAAFYRNGCTHHGCGNASNTAVSGTDESRVNFVVHVLRYDLTISKMVEGLPEEKIPQSFTFKIEDSKNHEHTVTISNRGSATVTLPVGTATVTEVKSNVEGYSLAVKANGTDVTNGTGETTLAYRVSGAGTVAFTNTYTRQTGTLEVTKKVTGNIPANRIPENFKITVTGQDGYSSTQTVKNGESAVFTGIPTGAVTITEDISGAAVEHYLLSVTGSGKTATVAYGQTTGHTLTNDYTRKTTTVTVSKTVSGNMGSHSDPFPFTVTVKDTDGSIMSFNHHGNTVTEAAFSLKHGESVTLTDVPVGAVVTVKETTGGYKASAQVNGAAATVTKGSLTFTVSDAEADSVEVNNHRQTVVDTGIVLDSLPYVLILAGVIGAGVILFLQKRKNED